MSGPMSLLASEARASTLRILADMIERVPPDDDASFRDALSALLTAGVPAIAIARRAPTSVSTITRWAQGAFAPHPIIRTAVAALLPSTARECASGFEHVADAA